jgi:hypothetical protein
MDYKDKYIKYKNKYLKLKNLYGGMLYDTIDYTIYEDKITEQITKIANKHFTLKTEVLNTIINVYSSCIQITIICSADQENDTILLLYPEKENLSIETLIKCKENSGTTMLNQIISFAYELNNITLFENYKLKLKEIYLTDASFSLLGKIETNEIISISNLLNGEINSTILGCKYSLGYLNIILYKNSWYNRFGFFSDNHDSEIEYNTQILNLKLNELINKIIFKEIQNFENNYILINTKQIRESYFKNTAIINKKFLIILNNLDIKNEVDYEQKIKDFFKDEKLKIIQNNLLLLMNIIKNFKDLYLNDNITINNDNIHNIMKKINDKYIKIDRNEKESKYNCSDEKIKLITSLINKTGLILKYTSTLTKIL